MSALATKLTIPAKPGCTSPALGRRFSATLGRDAALTPSERRHLTCCLACQLERRAFAGLDAAPAVPSTALLTRLRTLAADGV